MTWRALQRPPWWDRWGLQTVYSLKCKLQRMTREEAWMKSCMNCIYSLSRNSETNTNKHLKGKINLSLQAGPRLLSPYSCRDFLFRGGRDGSQARCLRTGWHSVSSYVIVAIYSFALDPALPCLSPLPAPRNIREAALLLLRSRRALLLQFEGCTASGPSWFQHR